MLELDENQISKICGEHLPATLTRLSLNSNGLEEIDITSLSNLHYLSLKDNKLAILDTSSNVNLTELDLATNQLKTFNLKNNSLVKLNLEDNKVDTFSIGNNNFLSELNLSKNRLASLDLGSNSSLKCLYIRDNKELGEVSYLPLSLETLRADKQSIIKFDFKLLVNLKRLRVYNGDTVVEELNNLSEKVKFTSVSTQKSQCANQ
jgi:hypothetical protein